MCIASEEKRVEDNNNNNRQGCYIHGSANSVGESKLTGGREKKRIKKCAAAVKEKRRRPSRQSGHRPRAAESAGPAL
jgi:hypothetical protein